MAEKYVIDGKEIALSSDILYKSRRDKKYSYFKKIGNRYLMTNEPSLKYLSAILWYTAGKDKHIVLCLMTNQHEVITCIYHHRNFEFQIDDNIDSIESLEKYSAKLRDIYITVDNYILYGNFDIPGIPDYIRIDKDFITNTLKTSIPPEKVILSAALVVVAAVMLVIVYNQIKPKPKKNIPKVETYQEVYERINRESCGKTSELIKKLLSAKNDEAEKIIAVSGTKITVASLVEKPSYIQDGYIYKKDIEVSEIKDKKVNIDLPVVCPDTIPVFYKVSNIKSEIVKGTPYKVRIVSLQGQVNTPEEIIPALYASLSHCIAVEKINIQEGVKIEAFKYYKDKEK